MYTLDEKKINEYCHLIMLVLKKRELAMNNNIRLIDLIDHDEQMKKLHISEGYEMSYSEGINIGG